MINRTICNNNDVNEYYNKVLKELPIISIDMLKSYVGVMLNADNNGNAKTIDFGGEIRQRFSSQSLDRAIKEAIYSDDVYQTRFVPRLVSNRIKKIHPESTDEYLEAIKDVSILFFDAQHKIDNEVIVKQVTSISKYDIADIVAALLEKYPVNENTKVIYDEIEEYNKLPAKVSDKEAKAEKKTKKDTKIGIIKESLIKNAMGRKIDLRTAFYGKMATDKILKSIDSAITRNHPYSVNAIAGDTDTYTAVDEFMSGCGAAFYDDSDINASCYYHHRGIHTRIIFENLCNGMKIQSKEEIDEIVKLIADRVILDINTFVRVRPNTKKNSKQSNPFPHAVYITVGHRQEMTRDTAFEKAIKGTPSVSIAEQAVEKMKEDIEWNNKMFSVPELEKGIQKELWIGYIPDKCPAEAEDVTMSEALTEVKEVILDVIS